MKGRYILPIILFAAIGVGELLLRVIPYPELDSFLGREKSVVITDRKGAVLRILPLDNGLRRETIDFSNLPPETERIFIASEDRRFFAHPGVDGFAVLRGLVMNSRADRTVSGASTITMQLADIVRPHRQDLWGKIGEAWDALRLEARLSKTEILRLWLGALPFGNQAEGIASGSRAYFDKPVYALSPEELTVLSVIPRHPEKYNPIESPELVAETALLTARRMKADFSLEDLAAAAARAREGSYVFYAPHFVSVIEGMLKDGSIVPEDGKVVTSLDLEVQNFFHEELYKSVRRRRTSRITAGAGVLFDNHTGEILAYTGSIDFFDDDEGAQIDGVQVRRQPGSCLKPFLYAAAFERGWLPNMLVPDIPKTFGEEEAYTPMNFNNSYSGPVRLRVALASSLNIPAVYMHEQVGSEAFREYLNRTGISVSRDDMRRAGLGAVLGNVEVTLFDLTKGFAYFPRRGLQLDPSWIPRPEIDELNVEEQPLLSDESLYGVDIICNILSDPAARALGFGMNRAFTLPFSAMFKTGTSNQFQNIWALAATPDYTAGIWMGNVAGDTIIGRTGSSVPAGIAGEVLEFVQSGAPEFPGPAGAVETDVCSVSGKRVTPNCPVGVKEYLPEWYVESPEFLSCDFHVLEDGKIVTRYPEEYRGWAAEMRRSEEFLTGSTGTVQIVQPQNGAVYFVDPSAPLDAQGIKIEAVPGGEESLDLYINGTHYGTDSYPPHMWFFPLSPGEWELLVRSPSGQDSVTITVH